MNTYRILAFIAALGITGALAQEFDRFVTIERGFWRNADGRRISLKGVRVPIHFEKMQDAKQVNSLQSWKSRGLSLPGPADTGVYTNDHGNGSYFVNGFAAPCQLDDMLLLSGAVGAKIHTTVIGIDTTSIDLSNPFTTSYLNFQMFSTYVSGRGAGVSAFDGLTFDVALGTYQFGLPAPGTYRASIDWSPAWGNPTIDFTIHSSQIYWGMLFYAHDQFNFDDEWTCVFSRGGPTAGSSQDLFWYDQEPNGIFDETEADMFDPGNEANFLFVLDVTQNGVTDTRPPTGYTYLRGINLGGSLSDLWDSDNSYLVSRPGVVLSSNEAPVQIQMESTATTTTATAMHFILEAHTNITGFNQKIELWNFTTSAYTQIDSRNSTTTDSTVDASVSANPAQYIESGTRRVRAKLSWKQNAPILTYPWQVLIDRSVWQITHP